MVQTLTLTLTLTLTPQGGAARRGGVQPGLRAGRPARYNLARPLCPTLTLTLMPNQPALCVSIPTPTPRSGKLHFKNKFCNHCRNAITVPLTHVRALNQAQAMAFINKRSEGFWNHAPANMGGGQYRIINNTAGCIGPWLALSRDAAPYTEWLAAARSNPQPLKRPP